MKQKLMAALLVVCMVASMLFVPASAVSTSNDVGKDGICVTPVNVNDVTEDGVITGEVKGMVLVDAQGKDLKVTLKDATVAGRIEVRGATVVLEGTKANGGVRITGNNASLTMDKASSATDVAVAGTNATLKLDGTVTGVVVEKGATVASLTGVGVSKDNVVNNSANEIKVNDDTLGGKEENNGFAYVPDTPVRGQNPGEDAYDDTPAAPVWPEWDGKTGLTGNVKEHEHNYAFWCDTWPTCEEPGEGHYRCVDEDNNNKCTAVSGPLKVMPLGHKWYVFAGEPATCLEDGLVFWACANDDDCDAVKPGTDDNFEKIPALGHRELSIEALAPTCERPGHTSGLVCANRGCEFDGDREAEGHTYFLVPREIPQLEHDYKLIDGNWTCSNGCGYNSSDCPNLEGHKGIAAPNKCDICGATGTHGASDDDHKPGEDYEHNATEHWKIQCTVEGCEKGKLVLADTRGDHVWVKGSKIGMKMCSVCGYEVACTGNPDEGNKGHVEDKNGVCDWCGSHTVHGPWKYSGMEGYKQCSVSGCSYTEKCYGDPSDGYDGHNDNEGTSCGWCGAHVHYWTPGAEVGMKECYFCGVQEKCEGDPKDGYAGHNDVEGSSCEWCRSHVHGDWEWGSVVGLKMCGICYSDGVIYTEECEGDPANRYVGHEAEGVCEWCLAHVCGDWYPISKGVKKCMWCDRKEDCYGDPDENYKGHRTEGTCEWCLAHIHGSWTALDTPEYGKATCGDVNCDLSEGAVIDCPDPDHGKNGDNCDTCKPATTTPEV